MLTPEGQFMHLPELGRDLGKSNAPSQKNPNDALKSIMDQFGVTPTEASTIYKNLS